MNALLGALRHRGAAAARPTAARKSRGKTRSERTGMTMRLASASVYALAVIPRLSLADTDNHPNNKETCSLYMAPSSIPGTGFGVYTTRAHRSGDVVLQPDAPSVAVTDRDRHQPGGVMEHEWPQDNYFWSSYGQMQYEGNSVSEMVVTLGSLSNYHTYLSNVHPHGFVEYDDTLIDRLKDHGAGAFSYYSGHKYVASRDIEAGEEIFANYGENWLDTRGGWGETIPRRGDFEMGDDIIEILRERFLSESDTDDTANDTVFSAIQHIVSMYDERTASLLPETASEFLEMAAPAKKLAWNTVERRSLDWILENGKCLDNMIMKQSTIPQAGRGAFARRLLSEGSLVVPVPLLQIVDRESMNMYSYIINDEGEKVRDEDDMVGKQLLLNYCFGHNDSSMVLCPATNAILINHCSSRQVWEGECGENGPNAEYRWSSWDPDTSDWLQMSLEEISQKEGRGLSLDIYATRDIQEGEEIFIDYGEEWEEAWKRHVHDWIAPEEGSGFEDFSSVSKMNQNMETPRTMKEEKGFNPYPSNVFTACIYWDDDLSEREESILAEWEGHDWKHYPGREIIENFAVDGKDFILSDETYDYAAYWPCRVFIKEDVDEGESYTVRIFQMPKSSNTPWWHSADLPRLLSNYPRESLKFFNKPYKSDQHLSNAFRHHIGLRDDIFPQQWKDRSANEEE